MVPRTRSYVGRREFSIITYLLGVAGLLAAVAGPAYMVNGGTQARGAVTVPVTVRIVDSEGAPLTRAAVAVPDVPSGARVEVEATEVLLVAPGSTVVEQLLGRGDSALLGVCIGAAALLLLPVLRSVAAGRPFEPGSARRIAAVAGLVVLAGIVGPLLPQVAAMLVQERLGLTRTGAFTTGLSFDLLPLLVLTGVLVLAEAFRRGEQIAADVEGLV